MIYQSSLQNASLCIYKEPKAKEASQEQPPEALLVGFGYFLGKFSLAYIDIFCKLRFCYSFFIEKIANLIDIYKKMCYY
jgi:hypothetical protein